MKSKLELFVRNQKDTLIVEAKNIREKTLEDLEEMINEATEDLQSEGSSIGGL